MTRRGQHRDGTVDTIFAIDEIHLTLARAHMPFPCGDRRRHRGVEDGVCIHAVAKNCVLESGGFQNLLRTVMIDADERSVSRVRSEVGGVDNMLDTRLFGGVDCSPVLFDAMAHFMTADEEHPLRAPGRRYERFGPVEIEESDLTA